MYCNGNLKLWITNIKVIKQTHFLSDWSLKISSIRSSDYSYLICTSEMHLKIRHTLTRDRRKLNRKAIPLKTFRSNPLAMFSLMNHCSDTNALPKISSRNSNPE